MTGDPAAARQADNVGVYGKLPAAADFIAHNLPPQLIDAWDGWIRASLRAAGVNASAAAHEAFYESPAWRFWLYPGAIDDNGWVGVLLSSADRVGRPYPLALARRAATPPRLAPLPEALALDPLEAIALQAIDAQQPADTVIANLARLSAQPADATAEAQRAAAFGLDLPAALSAAARAGAKTLWWQYGWASQPACVAADAGLPSAEQTAALWLADWAARGWRPQPWGWAGEGLRA